MKNSKIYIQQTDEFAPNIEENLFGFSKNPAENIDLNYSARSPLRYPGGKTRGVEFITQFFPKNLDKLLSPFLVEAQLNYQLLRKALLFTDMIFFLRSLNFGNVYNVTNSRCQTIK